MYKSLILLIVLAGLCPSSVFAQWRKIANFVGPDGIDEYITCIYFLDLPGPPRIGFVGTGSRLYKTTDGGATWRQSWGGPRDYALYWVTDVCFNDSLTGWFSMFGDTDACYRTTDGGGSWKEVYSSPYGGENIFYTSSSNRLFLSLANDVNTGMRLSTDLGDSWHSILDFGANGIRYRIDTGVSQIAFLSDSIGIASGSLGPCDTCSIPDTNYGIFRTTDGGRFWNYTHLHGPSQSYGFGILSISRAPISFLASMGEVTVWRSDNYGANWSKIADFGPYKDSNNNMVGPYGTGYIKGDLSRLSIQTDSGMFVSTDSGVTWKNDGGPPCITSSEKDLFYSAKGHTYAAMTYGDGVLYSGGLWEELWPQSDVTPSAAPAGLEVSVYPNPTTGVVTISGASGAVEVENVLGERVMRNASRVMRDGSETLDLSSEPAGMYFVRVETAGGIVVKSIIKE